MKNIEIKKDFQIPGTNVVLEKGDCIDILTKQDLKNIKEKIDVKQLIKDIEKSFDNTDEGKAKVLQLFKGLIFSDDPEANKFMKALDAATTKIAKDMGAKKESSFTYRNVEELKQSTINRDLPPTDAVSILTYNFDYTLDDARRLVADWLEDYSWFDRPGHWKESIV